MAEEDINDEISRRAFNDLFREHGYDKPDRFVEILLEFANEQVTSHPQHDEFVETLFELMKKLLPEFN